VNSDINKKSIRSIIDDTSALIKQDYLLIIDSVTLDQNKFKRLDSILNDSILVVFASIFDEDTVTLIQNDKYLFQDTIQTEYSSGLATSFYCSRDSSENKFDLRINRNWYNFIEPNEFNFIHIFHSDDTLRIIPTNKIYRYY